MVADIGEFMGSNSLAKRTTGSSEHAVVLWTCRRCQKGEGEHTLDGGCRLQRERERAAERNSTPLLGGQPVTTEKQCLIPI